MSEILLVEQIDQTAIVTLNRPDVRNALSRDLMKQLSTTLRRLGEDENVSAIILTGSGNAFCAGLDLKELRANGLGHFTTNREIDIIRAMASVKVPLIGAINGPAATGGFEIALSCDILIASPQAQFIDTHAKIGLVAGWGLTQRLPRLIGANRAREVSFTGAPLSAERAEAWGLVNRIVDRNELIPTCMTLTKEMAACDRTALIRCKRVMNEGAEMPLGAALRYENLAMDFHHAAAVLKTNIGT